jgi:NAD(P)-dependent dehydrogenase (short-subunit alcohol dehydrogenase family)
MTRIATRRIGVLTGLLVTGLLTALPAAAGAATVMITGANSGIGLEFARQYAAKGWTVIATHRRAEPPQTLTDLAGKFNKVRIESLDVTNIEQVKRLAEKLADVPIDVLINNAGVYNDRSKCAGDDESCPGDWSVENFGSFKYSLLDTMLAVNVKGPLLVCETFFRNVQASTQKKIIAISSSNGSLTGKNGGPEGAVFYRLSKAALNREMQLVAAATKKDGVTVVMFNPGPTLTEHQEYLHSYSGMLTTSFTVGNMIKTIDKATLADTGRFLRYDGVTEPW